MVQRSQDFGFTLEPRQANWDLAVWRVPFWGRLPGQPRGLFETTIVTVDAGSGEVVSISRT